MKRLDQAFTKAFGKRGDQRAAEPAPVVEAPAGPRPAPRAAKGRKRASRPRPPEVNPSAVNGPSAAPAAEVKPDATVPAAIMPPANVDTWTTIAELPPEVRFTSTVAVWEPTHEPAATWTMIDPPSGMLLAGPSFPLITSTEAVVPQTSPAAPVAAPVTQNSASAQAPVSPPTVAGNHQPLLRWDPPTATPAAPHASFGPRKGVEAPSQLPETTPSAPAPAAPAATATAENAPSVNAPQEPAAQLPSPPAPAASKSNVPLVAVLPVIVPDSSASSAPTKHSAPSPAQPSVEAPRQDASPRTGRIPPPQPLAPPQTAPSSKPEPAKNQPAKVPPAKEKETARPGRVEPTPIPTGERTTRSTGKPQPATKASSSSTPQPTAPPAATARPHAAAPVKPLRPLFEVDRLPWPSVCQALLKGAPDEWHAAAAELLSHASQGENLTLVTSRRRAEGRTTLALCLAKALATQGARVALVDGDFHKAQLVRQMKLLPQAGWEQVLRGEIPLEEALVESMEDRVVLLPLMGPLPDNQVLQSERLAEHLQELCRDYDQVVVDAGPLADGEAGLDQLLDAATFSHAIVVRDARYTSAAELDLLLDRLNLAKQVHVAENCVAGADKPHDL